MNGRIRTLKPEWLDDEVMAAYDDATRLLSVALILMADDYGNGRAAPMFVAGRVWTYSSEPMEAVSRKTREGLARLSQDGFIDLYEVAGQHYFHIRNWSKHQKVDHPSRPTCPRPSDSRGPRESLVADRDRIGEEEERKDSASAFAVGTDPDIPLPSEPPKRRRAARGSKPPAAPLPFTIAQLLDVLRETAGERLTVDQFGAEPQKYGPRLTKVIRELVACGYALDDVRRAGEVIATWHRPRSLGWLATSGELLTVVKGLRNGKPSSDPLAAYRDPEAPPGVPR